MAKSTTAKQAPREQLAEQLAEQQTEQTATIERVQQQNAERKQTEAVEQDADNDEISADITQEMADIFSMVKNLERQVETSTKLNEELKTDFDETQKMLSEESTTRGELEDRLGTVEEKAAQAGKLSKDIAYTENERQKLSKLLGESHQQLQALTGDYERLSDRVTAADARAKNAIGLEKEMKVLQAKVETSDDQMSSMKQQLEQQTSAMDEANGTLQQEIAKRKKSEQVMAAVKERLKGLSL